MDATPVDDLALPADNDLLQLLFATLDEQQMGSCLYDNADRVVAWNRQFLVVYPELATVVRQGLSHQDLIRGFFRANLSPRELPQIERHVAAAYRRHQRRSNPYVVQRRDGGWIRVEWRSTADGCRLSLTQDVTGQQQGLSGQPDIKDVFANLDVAFALFDAGGGFVSANRRYAQLFPDGVDLNRVGVPYASHLRRHARSALAPVELPRCQALLRRSFQLITGGGETLIFQRRGGGWLKLEERRTAGGGLISLWSDVSERVRAQTEVLRLKDRLTDAIESLADGFALFDAEDRLVLCNTGYKTFQGSINDVMVPGRRWRDIARERLARGQFEEQPADPDAWLAEMEARRHRNPAPYELRMLGGGWIRATDRPTREGGLVSIRTDITTLKQREAELSRYNAILGAIGVGAARLLGDTTLDSAVRVLLEQLGRAMGISRVVVFQVRQDVGGRHRQRCRFEWQRPGVASIGALPHYQDDFPGAGDPIQIRWDEARRGGEVVQARTRELPDGELRRQLEMEGVQSLLSVPIRVAGQWWGHISFNDCEGEHHWHAVEVEALRIAALLFAGVVERARVDAELRESEQRFRSIVETLPVSITHEGDGTIVYLSPALAQLLGCEVTALQGRAVSDIHMDPKARPRLLDRLRPSGALDDAEVLLRHRDGTPIPVTLTTRRILYGGEWALISAITDLRSRKAAEAEIARQREALHQADKLSALGSLLAGVAHELNNPLAVLVGQALMLEQDLSGQASLAARAGKIRSAAERCDRIIKTFLAMARQRPVEQGEVRLGSVVDSVLELTGYGLRASGIQVVRELDGGLPVLWGGRDPLSQLVLNLVINAQQALQGVEGRRVLRVSTYTRGEHVVLEVADSGPGIPEGLRERVFEPFYTTKPVGMGTGIGLSLCRNIVMTHGGSLLAETAPEGGALLRVVLPVRTGPVEGGAPGVMEAPEGPGQSQRILIVDDEREIAELLGEILHQAGYRCEQVGSGREALARLQAGGDYELIVSDIRMPDLDGPGLYRALRERYPRLAERLVFITGDMLGEAVAKELAGARIPVLEKPFRPREVRQLVADKLSALRGEKSAKG